MKKILVFIILISFQSNYAQENQSSKISNDSVNDETIFNTAGVEVVPEFPGGIRKFQEFLIKNFKSPNDRNFKGGKVIVQFVVDKDGSLTDITVHRDAGFGSAEEAIRVFKACPKWSPAMQNGKLVRCTYVQTITLNATL